MKKAITILAILAIVVGAVFADKTNEAHSITIKADVTETVPAFKLVLGQVYTNGSYVINEGQPEEAEVPYNTYDNAETSYSEEYGDVNWNLDVGGTVTVYAKLANKPKEVQNYRLTFSDGVFEVTRNAADGFLKPSTVVVTAGDDDTGITNMAGGGTTSIANPGDDRQTGGQKPVVSYDAVTFHLNGTTVTTTDAVLATAAYTYTGDPTIDPTEGLYEATITLTVAAY